MCCLSVPLVASFGFDNVIVSLDFARAKVGLIFWVIWKMGEVVVNYSQDSQLM